MANKAHCDACDAVIADGLGRAQVNFSTNVNGLSLCVSVELSLENSAERKPDICQACLLRALSGCGTALLKENGK